GCDGDYICADPGDNNCNGNGTCEAPVEGCNCEECWTDPNCTDNVQACDGGAPDRTCADGEDCACPDCLGTLACISCRRDGQCTTVDPCYCNDCLADPFCTNARNCTDDG